MTSPATEILFGGAAGGGKSFLMRAAAIIWCAAVPHLQVYLFRRNYVELIKSHMEGPKGLRALLAPWVEAGLVQIVRDEVRWYNSARIFLCHCNTEADRYDYQSAEMHVLLIDELTHFTELIYRFLRGRVRKVGVIVPKEYDQTFPKILCASNPGNIGHHFVKKMFIDPRPPLEVWRTPDQEGGMLRQFVPAKLEDNPSMEQDDPTYRSRLRGLGSPQLVRMYEAGDWSVVVGAYFSEWDPNVHIIKPHKVPDHVLRFGAMDWGRSSPSPFGWYYISDGTTGYPAGAIILYREWYCGSAPGVGLELTAEEYAKEVLARGCGDQLAYIVADPDIFRSKEGPSIAEKLHMAGLFGLIRGDNTRKAGWSELAGRLRGQDGRPMLYYFETCRDAIRCLPAVQHDDNDPEDVDSRGDDHTCDRDRYAVMSRPWVVEAPKPIEPIGGLECMTYDELWEREKERLGLRRRI